MKTSSYLFSQYISGGSTLSDNSGLTPQAPKYKRFFVNNYTNQTFSFTDIQTKKYKRRKQAARFFNKYRKAYNNQLVSLLAVSANQEHYHSISQIIDLIKKTLQRKGLSVLAYVWQRDVGDQRFEKHYHITLAVEPIDKRTFKHVFKSKHHDNYSIQFVKSVRRLIGYLCSKEVYGMSGQRTYGCSQKLDSSLEMKQINVQRNAVKSIANSPKLHERARSCSNAFKSAMTDLISHKNNNNDP